MDKINDIPIEKRVYIDESAVEERLRLYARAVKGRKVSGKISGKRSEKQNISAGLCNNKLIAPFIFKGTTDAHLFTGWLEQCLVPELKKNQTVILDNARYHHAAETIEIIEKAGCSVLFLPPYSPNLNKIEGFWASIKKHIRKLSLSFLKFSEKLDDAVILYC